MARVATAQKVPAHQVLVVLQEVKRPVLRRLLIPSAMTLDRLHLVLQAAMGWTNSHLHQFRLGDLIFRAPGQESKRALGADERTIALGDVLMREGATMTYEYDISDLWTHEIVFERMLKLPSVDARAVCIGGEGTCPPEDCGGAGGYADLLAILGNPKHPQHRERTKWAGKDFRPDVFDLEAINQRLARLT